jgi:hypothetical protein
MAPIIEPGVKTERGLGASGLTMPRIRASSLRSNPSLACSQTVSKPVGHPSGQATAGPSRRQWAMLLEMLGILEKRELKQKLSVPALQLVEDPSHGPNANTKLSGYLADAWTVLIGQHRAYGIHDLSINLGTA